jgi:prevent-host-death family protein
MAAVNVHAAKTHLSRLLERERAHAGEEITIAKNGRPYARLVPLPGRRPERKPGTLKGLIEVGRRFFDLLPSGWSGNG